MRSRKAVLDCIPKCTVNLFNKNQCQKISMSSIKVLLNLQMHFQFYILKTIISRNLPHVSIIKLGRKNADRINPP